MCLTIPGKIKSIKRGVAEVKNGSKVSRISLGVVLDAKVGDWVLYAGENAVKRISEDDAKEIISLLEDNYHPVNIDALPLKYKKIVYKVRNSTPTDSFHRKDTDNSKSKTQDTNHKQISNNKFQITKSDIKYLLELKSKNNLESFYSEANTLRKDRIKDFVCIHGIVEFSNYCKNNCLYCGIRRDAKIKRYRMGKEDIVRSVQEAVEDEGYKLVVLQSGEDFSYSDQDLINIVKDIKKNARVFIFLSVGERSTDFYKMAFEAGATGSLFRFETSNPELYKKMHPGHNLKDRLRCLEEQIKIGYYVATGGLIGLPRQTVSDLADDLMLVKKLGVPMLSSGPWIPSENTSLETNPKIQDTNPKQISNSNIQNQNNSAVQQFSNETKLRLTLNYIAAARLLMPEIKIPITTALETLDPEGRHKGLLAGANSLMFNITPKKYSKDYMLYNNKYREREKVWQKYGLFKGEESYEMLEERLRV